LHKDFFPAGITLDAKTDAADSWLLSAGKSFKTCTEDPANKLPVDQKLTKVTCEAINTHWFKNFETSEKEQDIQLLMDHVGKEASIFGWTYT
jgi:hypothetical protein